MSLVLSVGRPAQAGGQPLCPVGGEDHQGGWLDGSQAPQSRKFLEAEFDPAVFSEFDFRLWRRFTNWHISSKPKELSKMFLHFQNDKNEELHMELFSVFWHEQGRHKQASNATVTISAL